MPEYVKIKRAWLEGRIELTGKPIPENQNSSSEAREYRRGDNNALLEVREAATSCVTVEEAVEAMRQERHYHEHTSEYTEDLLAKARELEGVE